MGKRVSIYSLQLVKESSKVYNFESKIIRSPQDARDIIVEVLNFENLPAEHFVIFSLSTKNEVLGIHTVFKGSLNSSLIHPREVFQTAIINNSAGIVAFHNHPSGDPYPSSEDIAVTKRLQEAGKLLGIDLMDHIIVGKNGRYKSLKEMGQM